MYNDDDNDIIIKEAECRGKNRNYDYGHKGRQKRQNKIVAKALAGQRYPCPVLNGGLCLKLKEGARQRP